MESETRSVGFWGAVGALVGYVVGASIFVVPAELLGRAGPAVTLSYWVAAVPAALACIVGAVVGNALPESGASYVAARRAISPFAGFLMGWSLLIAVVFGFALVSYGFADYFRYLVPAADARLTALLLIAAFALLNVSKVRDTVAVQGIMVMGFVLILLVFSIGALVYGDWKALSPIFPHGEEAAMTAAVPAFFSFAGIHVLIEIGGEVRDPMRTIPRALFASFLLIALLYTLVTLGLTLTLPAQVGGDAAMARAASGIFPPWFTIALVVGALLAAATSVNGMFLAHSRDVQAFARGGLLPTRLAAVSVRGVPAAAVMVLAVAAEAGILLGASVLDYAVTTVVSVMVVLFLLGLSALRLPRALPEEFARSRFRLGPALHRTACVGLMATALAFFAKGIWDSVPAAVLYGVLLSVGLALYFVRTRFENARSESS